MFIRRSSDIICSYKNLRRAIGILGILLPVLCLIGVWITHDPMQPSISHCYYTNARDVFTGVMILVSFFLITYHGYDLLDDWITNITGLFGIGIALCPCLPLDTTFSHVGYFNLDPALSNSIHSSCAVLFFSFLSIISIFLFTKSNTSDPTVNKKKRNNIYITCGCVLLISLLVLFIVRITLGEYDFNRSPVIFFLESVMLIAFGISWLVKGEVMCGDTIPDSSLNVQENQLPQQHSCVDTERS
jgi:hypothetical protein